MQEFSEQQSGISAQQQMGAANQPKTNVVVAAARAVPAAGGGTQVVWSAEPEPAAQHAIIIRSIQSGRSNLIRLVSILLKTPLIDITCYI